MVLRLQYEILSDLDLLTLFLKYNRIHAACCFCVSDCGLHKTNFFNSIGLVPRDFNGTKQFIVPFMSGEEAIAYHLQLPTNLNAHVFVNGMLIQPQDYPTNIVATDKDKMK